MDTTPAGADGRTAIIHDQVQCRMGDAPDPGQASRLDGTVSAAGSVQI